MLFASKVQDYYTTPQKEGRERLGKRERALGWRKRMSFGWRGFGGCSRKSIDVTLTIKAVEMLLLVEKNDPASATMAWREKRSSVSSIEAEGN